MEIEPMRLVPIASALALMIAASAATAGPVEVRVSNVGPKGQVFVMVCTEAQMMHGCPNHVAVAPHAAVVSVPFNLPPGRYEVSVFQDVDGNGRLTFGMMGGPIEPWGYSRDAKAVMGPARFEDAAVNVGDAGVVIPVRLGFGAGQSNAGR
jgi:uncharacterized protein (DUF2141 family)